MITTALMRAAARLPLAWLHRAGALLGGLVYRLSPTYATRLSDNLKASGVARDETQYEGLRRAAIREAGKAVLELPKVWFAPIAELERLVRCDTWPVVEAAQRAGRGIIFLTPHLGCFEISAIHVAQRLPLTVLYRQPRMAWLEPLMLAGRSRGQARLAPADVRGVRTLFKALKRGEAIGVLPDQAPGAGEGVWADFFGRPAYTMTLASRLQQASGAAVVLTFAERLPSGAGYHLTFEALDTTQFDERALNTALEALIRRCPAQYLWSYNRYKTPAGARPQAVDVPGAGA